MNKMISPPLIPLPPLNLRAKSSAPNGNLQRKNSSKKEYIRIGTLTKPLTWKKASEALVSLINAEVHKMKLQNPNQEQGSDGTIFLSMQAALKHWHMKAQMWVCLQSEFKRRRFPKSRRVDNRVVQAGKHKASQQIKHIQSFMMSWDAVRSLHQVSKLWKPWKWRSIITHSFHLPLQIK